MILINRKKLFIKISELFFENNYDKIDLDNCDIIIVSQSSKKTKNSLEYITLHIDLQKSEEILRSQIHKNTRYKISRCDRRDQLITTIIDNPTEKDLNTFIKFYNEFSKMKSLAPANKNKLHSLNEVGALSIGLIKDDKGSVLCSHSHIVSDQRARLLYSSSLYRGIKDSSKRNLIGRANRLLHWKEIIHYKNASCIIYDFGGISAINESEQDQIDLFKIAFGGDIVVEYNQRIGISILGKLILKIYNPS